VIFLFRTHIVFYFFVFTLASVLFLLHLEFIHSYIFYVVGFNILVDVIFKFLNNLNAKDSAIIRMIISTIFRFFFSLIFILFFHYFSGESTLIFILNFLSVYLLFIIFEITILLINLQRE